MAPRLVALGGGGYDLENVARGWTAAWAVINGVELPAALPVAYVEEARAFGLRAKNLWDEPAEIADENGLCA